MKDLKEQNVFQVSEMRRDIKLTKQEKEIENALMAGKFVDVEREELERISQAITRRRKDAVLNIRINSQDLRSIKQKNSE